MRFLVYFTLISSFVFCFLLFLLSLWVSLFLFVRFGLVVVLGSSAVPWPSGSGRRPTVGGPGFDSSWHRPTPNVFLEGWRLDSKCMIESGCCGFRRWWLSWLRGLKWCQHAWYQIPLSYPGPWARVPMVKRSTFLRKGGESRGASLSVMLDVDCGAMVRRRFGGLTMEKPPLREAIGPESRKEALGNEASRGTPGQVL